MISAFLLCGDTFRFRKIDESYAGDVGAFREHPHHHEADVHVDVLSRERVSPGRGQSTVRAPMVWSTVHDRPDVRRHLLDVAGMAAADVGSARRDPRDRAVGPLQLLDRYHSQVPRPLLHLVGRWFWVHCLD